jgi:hypothetical protein
MIRRMNTDSADRREGDDPVARNRAAPRRHVPGRPELGADTTRRLRLLTLTILLTATAVLVTVLMVAR